MPVEAKLALSFLSVIVLGLFMLIDMNVNNAGPHWLWRGGGNDSIRSLICHTDGSLRPHTKAFFAVLCFVWLLIVWIFIP